MSDSLPDLSGANTDSDSLITMYYIVTVAIEALQLFLNISPTIDSSRKIPNLQESWHAANQFLWRGEVAPEKAGCTRPCVPTCIGIGML